VSIDLSKLTESAEWREIDAIISGRMSLILKDLVDPGVCSTVEKLAELQAEYRTCMWFKSLPYIKMEEESEGGEGEKYMEGKDGDDG
jgi:hypothetical protein